MQVLLLIRHAAAADREDWRGEDALRPLTDAGCRQATRLVRAVKHVLAELGRNCAVASLRTSPAVRCIKTVEPLANALGVELQNDAGLFEGSEIVPPSPRHDGIHIICAHGDNIPWLLDAMKIDWDGRCKKGSMWVIQRDGRGRVTGFSYHTIRKD
jgi:8-oxo-dGTP diphosphatase